MKVVNQETSKLQKYTPPNQVPAETLFFDAGGTTFHVHTCPATSERPSHVWMCNSPYCNSLNTLCPDHGIDEPVTIGREPWKR